MNKILKSIIDSFDIDNISSERKEVLDTLIKYIRHKIEMSESIRLNFICTHNSRRSHLSQIWAHTMAHYFGLNYVNCYSGGTEETAMFSQVAKTLMQQGFDVIKLSDTINPVYAIKYAKDEPPIICFSKLYDHQYNPLSHYAAIVTCNNADEACPIVHGAEARFAIKYDDPKAFDGTDLMSAKYVERSLQIANEMWYVFSQIN
jgi:arsenate reductase (thioredoxin)